MNRTSEITRTTSETVIKMQLNLDGTGISQVSTGIGFFDHMLISFAKHGLFDLNVSVVGDLNVDGHHTVEDTGIVLGQAIKEALGKKESIVRFGSFLLPMDESLIMCAIDLGGRPYLNYDLSLESGRVGEFDTELVREFFYAVSYSAGMNLHLKQLDGCNRHHIIEAAFKSFARALSQAVQIDQRIQGVMSTKGTI